MRELLDRFRNAFTALLEQHVSCRNPYSPDKVQKTLHSFNPSLCMVSRHPAPILPVLRVGCTPRPPRPERITTRPMDRVRFGRALGEGTRDAARALLKAADAAAAPTPLSSISKTAPAGFLASSGSTTAPQAVRRTDVVGVKDRRPGHRRLGQALWTPLRQDYKRGPA